MANKMTVSELRKLNLAAGGKFFTRGNMRGDGSTHADHVSDFEVIEENGHILLQYRDTIRNQFKSKLVWEFIKENSRLRPFAG